MACEICTRTYNSEFFDSMDADLSDVEFQQIIMPPYVIGQAILFSSCRLFFFLSSFFFPRLISAVAEWMSTILAHMVHMWP